MHFYQCLNLSSVASGSSFREPKVISKEGKNTMDKPKRYINGCNRLVAVTDSCSTRFR